MSQKPTVGRIVHYWSPGDAYGIIPQQPFAAMITMEPGADKQMIQVTVFPPAEGPYSRRCRLLTEIASVEALKGSGCCTWPPMEE